MNLNGIWPAYRKREGWGKVQQRLPQALGFAEVRYGRAQLCSKILNFSYLTIVFLWTPNLHSNFHLSCLFTMSGN
jgi:hypothetical protein